MNFLPPLLHLSERWQSAPRDWSRCETLENIEFGSAELNREEALTLDLGLLQELSDAYNDSLEFVIRSGELEVFRLHPGMTEQDLISLRRDSDGASTVQVHFRIRKSRLAELCYTELFNFIEGQKIFHLYFFKDRLVAYLKGSTFESLENSIWRSQKDATVIIILPHDNICLAGQRLLVWGGNYLEQADLQQIERLENQRINRAYSVCRENLKWQDAWLSFLTPWHLYVKDQDSKSPKEIRTALADHFLNSFLLYSADFTFSLKKDGKDVRISRYATQEQNLEITHQIAELPDKLLEKQKDLLSILNWIYDPQWSVGDRLTLAQQNIVDMIYQYKEEDRFQALFQKAEDIKKNIDWHWETFTNKKIDAYFGVVKDYEDYLNQVAQGFSTDITNIQKSLSETLIAAIAVVIGSFIAALFQDTFNPFVFQVGLIVYAVYVLGVPLLYNMILRWKEYQSYQVQRDARQKRLRESLPDSKIKEIWDSWQIDTISNRFKCVFRITVVIYILVILLLVLAAWLVPPGVIANGVYVAAPTATPTVVPTIAPTVTYTVSPSITPTIIPTISATSTAVP